MNKYFSLILFALIIVILSCNDDETNEQNTTCIEKCNQEPEVGQCNAAIPIFYFNKNTNKCDTFIWGGCNGVVPFKTLQECTDCGCK